jgi:hypothetical protein
MCFTLHITTILSKSENRFWCITAIPQPPSLPKESNERNCPEMHSSLLLLSWKPHVLWVFEITLTQRFFQFSCFSTKLDGCLILNFQKNQNQQVINKNEMPTTSGSNFYLWTKKSRGQQETRGVTHCGLDIYIKRYLKAKKNNYENSNISPGKNIIFKKSSERNPNPSRYYFFITNLKFEHKPKVSSFKNPHMKLDLLPRGQNLLSYYTL